MVKLDRQNWKYLKYLLVCGNTEKGLTLIELLVVIIIIGILASIALPNFLRQIGKAREVEYQNVVGAINRAQQAHHFEKQVFAQGANDTESLNRLGLSIDSKYIDNNGYNIVADVNKATTFLVNSNFANDGTRAYSGGMFYSAGVYQGTSCRSNAPAQEISPPSAVQDCGTNIVLK